MKKKSDNYCKVIRISKVLFFIFYLFITGIIFSGSNNFKEDDLKLYFFTQISKEINFSSELSQDKIFEIRDIYQREKEILSENEIKYFEFLLNSLEKSDFYSVNFYFLSDKSLKMGLVFYKKEGSEKISSLVLVKDPELSDNMEKIEDSFYKFVEYEDLLYSGKKDVFMPIFAMGRIYGGEDKIYFLKSEENWKKLMIFIPIERKNSKLRGLYRIGKILSAGFGPFFVRNDYFVVSVKEKFKDKYYFLEALKVRLMAALYLKYLLKKEIIKNFKEEEILSLFKEDIGKEKSLRSFVKKYFSNSESGKGNFNEFRIMKKLLKKIIDIEVKGDLKAFETMLDLKRKND